MAMICKSIKLAIVLDKVGYTAVFMKWNRMPENQTETLLVHNIPFPSYACKDLTLVKSALLNRSQINSLRPSHSN